MGWVSWQLSLCKVSDASGSLEVTKVDLPDGKALRPMTLRPTY